MKRILSYVMSCALALGVFNFGPARSSASGQRRAGRAAAAAIRFAPRVIKENNRKKRYTVSAKYPQALGTGDARLAGLNNAIKSLITEQVEGFRKDFKTPDERMGPTGSYFDIEYTVSLATNDLVSVMFYVNSFYEGAAHPNHNALAFNYSFETGKTLALEDLFKPHSNYLETISGYSVRALKRKLGAESDSEWISNGAGPKLENYKNWNITRRGLTVIFDPYQVASYAEGEHEVLIPYSALRSIIDPAGPLARIAR